MTVIRSKDVVTINDLAEEKRSSDGPSVLEAIEGFQGYAERTLIDKKVSGEISLGDCVFEPGAVVPSHRHDVEEAFYVFEGTGTAVVNDEEFEVSVGDALHIPRGARHSFRNESGRPWRMVFAYSALEATTIFD